MAEPRFQCSNCGHPKPRNEFHEAKRNDRKRPVRTHCRACRSEKYFAKRYGGSVCAQCSQPRRLERNKVCRNCNEESGLRYCRGACGELLPLFLKFDGRRKICRDCWKTLRRLRRKGGS